MAKFEGRMRERDRQKTQTSRVERIKNVRANGKKIGKNLALSVKVFFFSFLSALYLTHSRKAQTSTQTDTHTHTPAGNDKRERAFCMEI